MTTKEQSFLSRTLASILGAAIGAGIALVLAFMGGDDNLGGELRAFQLDEGGFAMFQDEKLVGLVFRHGAKDLYAEKYYLFKKGARPLGVVQFSEFGLGKLQAAAFAAPGLTNVSTSIEFRFLGSGGSVNLSQIERAAREAMLQAEVVVGQHRCLIESGPWS